MENQKVALYCRVSTKDKKQTTENQSRLLIDYCQRNGLEYDLFEERESTRKTRPVKQQLLAKLRAGHYPGGLIVFRLDRWARSMVELITEIKELHDKGIGFISLSDSIDFSTASGRLQVHLLSAFAQFQRELISENVVAGLERTKAKGTKLGRRKGSKDKKQRSSEGYVLRMQTNPPPNNSRVKIQEMVEANPPCN